ncbi:type II toxin-antitoxin system PemK/MazF family toxin [Jidongwangia harbinensis]|uniref:type II toxin-antitoxin system PemK/MazF family toxin n=1 Tax=Jidongwangia harbinensis TaxID=2878561 RepID=UPI001CD9E4D1|nr:type II toxin-antitoxin system PemK/MazF family toxin [Jidongwangia harbinensis]MCA2213661.1 type II toxin-antitoxin system PemK/MazF family toxin [Jidongwangia harbinensis]
MKRGEIWTVTRAGHQRSVVIVGHDAVTAARNAVLAVPISDVQSPNLIQPALNDADGSAIGVALTAGVGEVTKSYLTARTGTLAGTSVESLNVALRAALDL